ncbi:ADP-ribosylglycohydrolase family protein [Saccharopolyspora sp. NPDC002376]
MTAEEERILDEFRAFAADSTRHVRGDAELLMLVQGDADGGIRDKAAEDTRVPFPACWPESAIGLTGMFFGGAVGDAFASSVQHCQLSELINEYDAGTLGAGVLGPTTARTRRNLLLAEALLRGHARIRRSEKAGIQWLIRDFHRRWLQVAGRSGGSPRVWLTADPAMTRPHQVDEDFAIVSQALLEGGAPAGSTGRGTAAGVLVHAAPLALLWDRMLVDDRSSSQRHQKLIEFADVVTSETHSSPVDRLAVATLVVLLRASSYGYPLARSISTLKADLERWPGHEPVVEIMNRVLDLHREKGGDPVADVAGLVSQVDPGTALGALAIGSYAACGADEPRTDFAGALAVSVMHPGDRAASAIVCGQLIGMFSGPGVLPRQWIEQLDLRDVVAELAADTVAVVGPESAEAEDQVKRYASEPVSSTTASQPPIDPGARSEQPGAHRRSELTVLGDGGSADERRDRFFGAVLGFAIGDRLGSAVSELTWPEIQDRFGTKGISRYAAAAEFEQLRSNPLRLALSLDILIRADQARLGGEDADLGQLLNAGYQRCAERFPDFTNDVIAESTARRLIDPDFRRSLTQVGNSADEIVRYLPLALWTEVYPSLSPLVRQAVSGLGDVEAASIASFVVLLQLCIFSKNPVRAIGMVRAESGELSGPELRTALMKAEQVARRGITPAELEQLGTGNTATEAIAIAVCAAESAEFDLDESLRIAVNHSGSSAVTGALCGALLGASFEGAQRLPEHWLKGLDGGLMLYRLAQDAGEQFGPQPPDNEERRQRYAASSITAPPQPIEPHERFIGSMLAGAVGDALGYAIEFHDIDLIRRTHGEAGVTGPVLRDGSAHISDDTQMMLFTLEGLIRAHVARRMNPVDNDPVPEVQHAYQRWFHTQNQPWAQAGGPYARHLQQPDGWLITNRELFSPRAPGSTCMSALARFAQTHQHATLQNPVNDSKGCGGVMRATPVAVWSNDPAEVFHAAVGTAALTHSHPSGYLSAGVLAVIVHQLIRDVSLADSVRLARELLLRWRGHEEQVQVLDAAVELAKRGPVAPEVIKDTLGQGWVGEEALAIGLYAALATDNLRDALLLSVNHSGDSDSTGIVCGNIAGALHGARAVPPEWLASLELRGVIETLARDALAEFSPGPPTDPAWTRRYPAW